MRIPSQGGHTCNIIRSIVEDRRRLPTELSVHLWGEIRWKLHVFQIEILPSDFQREVPSPVRVLDFQDLAVGIPICGSFPGSSRRVPQRVEA